MRRLAVLSDRDPWGTAYLKETERAARALGITFRAWVVHTEAELDRTFAELEREPPDGLAVGIGLLHYHKRVIRFAASHRLPAIYAVGPAVGAGGLMSYSTSYWELVDRTAAIIDRVLHGTKPADIPVEQSTKYVLAINRTTAKAMGLSIPRSVLLRAEVVIE